MKNYSINLAISIQVEGENKEEAEAKGLTDSSFSIKDRDGKELNWTFLNQETFEL